jgi:cell wall-associated NlpC family hydrolase
MQYTPLAPVPGLVGRRFELGRQDCYTLIRDHFFQELGLVLPDWWRAEFWRQQPGTPGADLYRAHFAEAGFELMDTPDRQTLRRHDVILMRVLMPEGDERPNHAAVYLGYGADQGAGGLILHHLARRISGRARWSAWQRHATHVLRHRSLL